MQLFGWLPPKCCCEKQAAQQAVDAVLTHDALLAPQERSHSGAEKRVLYEAACILVLHAGQRLGKGYPRQNNV